ncbi:hypothetical protein Tco_0324517 [Tanacetum coccineum]
MPSPTAPNVEINLRGLLELDKSDLSGNKDRVQEQATPEDVELAHLLRQLKDKCRGILKLVESFQSKSSENVFNTDKMVVDAYAVMTYMPQDFRGTLIRQQRERSEKNKRAEVDALVNSGGSICDRYALLWQQQMERRRQLAQLGSAAGVYKTVVKYLVGVPQVLLDFVRQINDDQGPMEEQRHRYGPPMYALTKMVLNIHLFLSLSWWRYEDVKLQKHQQSILEEAVNVYASELKRFLSFIGEVFANSPFFVTAEEAGTIEAKRIDDYKGTNIPAGTTYEVSLEVESVNSYIAWDFSVAQGRISMAHVSIIFLDVLVESSIGPLFIESQEIIQILICKMDIGFSIEYTNSLGQKTALRYKVDCIPPVVEPEAQARGTI